MSMDWTFSLDELEDSPSRRDDIKFDLEKSYRRKTAWFTEELGKELKWLVDSMNRFIIIEI